MKQIFVTLIMAFIVPFYSHYRIQRQGNKKLAPFNLLTSRQKNNSMLKEEKK
jgi:hypothetical protein